MKIVDYVREEFHAPDEPRRAPLPVFLMDVPYLLLRGAVPPLPVLNEILAAGRLGGGMSPGSRWAPFALGESEYAALVAALPQARREAITTGDARFVPDQIRIDPDLADYTDFVAWAAAVAAKYGPGAADKRRARRVADRNRGGTSKEKKRRRSR